ncbi:GDSL family lipase [Paenibacillus lemnae]|uniref:GDSL family lipase n=1 Tax=Paenibacillus lemnae TaxID=1330551 RepID=A0A848M766_PAELE|nr:GDSL-type esterase/lipase family protein [Paenibacillus lemnae]NMO96535.1 GDSL family lipase [Paenibacillus lemnae]
MKTAFQFDFGTGPAVQGYTKVGAEDWYSSERGYGFDVTSELTALDRDEAGELKRDFCIPYGATFRLDLPDGLYRVELWMGDRITETETTVKGPENQMLLHRVKTRAGQFVKHNFSIMVQGGQLKLDFSGLAPRLNAMNVAPTDETAIVFIAGDSTAANQSPDGYPYAGWGQMFSSFLKGDAATVNRARSGRSSKSYIEEKELQRIWDQARSGDYLLIQFGHNDQKQDTKRHTDPSTTYKQYLSEYVEGARNLGMTPVLITSVQRRFFHSDGSLKDTHGAYLDAVRELAAEKNVPLVDLADKSARLYTELGMEGSKSLFMWGAPGEFIHFSEGIQDNTHFQEYGALKIAELVVEGLKELSLQPLTLFFR